MGMTTAFAAGYAFYQGYARDIAHVFDCIPCAFVAEPDFFGCVRNRAQTLYAG